MKGNIFSSIRLTMVCLLFFSGIYPLVVLAIAQFAPNKGKGEVIAQNGKVYYANIGQRFTEDKYFWTRPSAVDYNAAGSAGSNKGPFNPDYLKMMQERIDTFLVHNPGIDKTAISSDMITASGSGLDPHISVQAANIQVKRIAKVRGIAEGNIQQLILSNIEKPLMALFGPERVNVLKLNIALDNLK